MVLLERYSVGGGRTLSAMREICDRTIITPPLKQPQECQQSEATPFRMWGRTRIYTHAILYVGRRKRLEGR